MLSAYLAATAVTIYADVWLRSAAAGPSPEHGILLLELDVKGDSHTELFLSPLDSCGNGRVQLVRLHSHWSRTLSLPGECRLSSKGVSFRQSVGSVRELLAPKRRERGVWLCTFHL